MILRAIIEIALNEWNLALLQKNTVELVSANNDQFGIYEKINLSRNK